MRFDIILQRLAPNAKYDFTTIEQSYLSRKPGDKEPVERVETVRVYHEYNKIIWNDELIIKPTLKECEIEWDIIQKEEADDEVDKKRVERYGSWQEQADMQYWDLINGTTTWKDHITSVKVDNPKI